MFTFVSFLTLIFCVNSDIKLDQIKANHEFLVTTLDRHKKAYKILSDKCPQYINDENDDGNTVKLSYDNEGLHLSELHIIEPERKNVITMERIDKTIKNVGKMAKRYVINSGRVNYNSGSMGITLFQKIGLMIELLFVLILTCLVCCCICCGIIKTRPNNDTETTTTDVIIKNFYEKHEQIKQNNKSSVDAGNDEKTKNEQKKDNHETFEPESSTTEAK